MSDVVSKLEDAATWLRTAREEADRLADVLGLESPALGRLREALLFATFAVHDARECYAEEGRRLLTEAKCDVAQTLSALLGR